MASGYGIQIVYKYGLTKLYQNYLGSNIMVGSFGKAYQVCLLSSHRSYTKSICCFSVRQTDKAASMAGKKEICNSVSTTPSPNKHVLFYPPTLPNHLTDMVVKHKKNY